MSSTPLENFPLVRSRNIEEVRAALARVYAKPVLTPVRGVGGFDATLNNCRVGHFELFYGTYRTAAEFDYPETNIIAQLFPLRGKGEAVCGRTSVSLGAGAGAIVTSQAAHQISLSDDFAQIGLRFDARALTQKLAAMTGATINEPLRMDLQPNSRNPTAQMLEQYIPLLIETLSDAHPPFPDWWIVQTEQLLMTLFLCGHRHNYSHLLEDKVADAAPQEVRRAEEYIEANAQQPITLEQLADVSGVSAFSLFSAFRKHRGYSPLSFLSQVRSRLRKP